MAAEPAPRIRVAELFAGVGGFRLGLEGVPDRKWEGEHHPLKVGDTGFDVIWSNQWEPTPKPKRGKKRRKGKQWASEIYVERFGEEGHTNEDIHEFTHRMESVSAIPKHDLLVGGFPCQDYSVARTISGEMGIAGEKGKLWEPIRKIISYVHANGTQHRPKAVLLENVPRLLNSPANARGLNFAKILYDLLKLGYNVEWRVINAADYGMPQQRSRVFILAYRTSLGGGYQSSPQRRKMFGSGNFGAPKKLPGPLSRWVFGDHSGSTREDWAVGPFGEAFPAECESYRRMALPEIGHWSDKQAPFGTAGYAWKGQMGDVRWQKQFCSWKAKPIKEEPSTIQSIMVRKDKEIYDPPYEIHDEELLRKYWYIKGEQKEWRIRKEDKPTAMEIDADGYDDLWGLYQACTKGYDAGLWSESLNNDGYERGVDAGIIYDYKAGEMARWDRLDGPSRTIVTAEIGKSASRMRHVIELDDGTKRHLMPIELERLNQFPDDWTDIEVDGRRISDSRRGFLMGNALVTGIIHRLSGPLGNLIHSRREEG